MKKCSRCLLEKPVTEFAIDTLSKDGFQYYCKQCQSAYHKAYREVLIASPATVHVESKVCLDCGLEKPRSQFGKKSSSKDKLNSYCKPCWKIRSREATKRFYAKKK